MLARTGLVGIAYMSGIGGVELVFLPLLFFVVVFGLLARKLRTPTPSLR